MRLRLAGFLGAVLLAGAALAAVVVVHRSGGAPAVAAAPFRGSVPPPGIAVPQFALRDQDGHAVRTADLRGKVVVLTVLDSRCRESCPVIASDIGRAWRLLRPSQRAHAVAIAISSNPLDDTRPRVRAFLRREHAEVIRYVTGPVPVMRDVWKGFQVLSSLASGTPGVHSAPVRIYGPDLTWRATQNAGEDLSPANLAHDVRLVLRQR